MVLRVDGTLELVLSVRRVRDHTGALGSRQHDVVRRGSALQEAVWRQPDRHLPLFGSCQLRRWSVGTDVPRLVAIDLRVLLLTTEGGLREIHLVTGGALLVVHRPRKHRQTTP